MMRIALGGALAFILHCGLVQAEGTLNAQTNASAKIAIHTLPIGSYVVDIYGIFYPIAEHTRLSTKVQTQRGCTYVNPEDLTAVAVVGSQLTLSDGRSVQVVAIYPDKKSFIVSDMQTKQKHKVLLDDLVVSVSFNGLAPGMRVFTKEGEAAEVIGWLGSKIGNTPEYMLDRVLLRFVDRGELMLKMADEATSELGKPLKENIHWFSKADGKIHTAPAIASFEGGEYLVVESAANTRLLSHASNEEVLLSIDDLSPLLGAKVYTEKNGAIKQGNIRGERGLKYKKNAQVLVEWEDGSWEFMNRAELAEE